MKDTISSRCCQIVKYVYYDNLLATDNWEYGSITEEQYRQANSKKALKEELTRCPKETPFANENNNTCFNCPATLPLFNLGTRKCIAECEHPGFVLNVTQHRCDYNRSCPPGQVFSNNSLTCEIDMGNITKSSCALSTPVWNKIKLRCEECPETSPFYDKHVKSCRKCTENEVFDSETKTCLNSALAKCPEGTFFNVYKN